MSKFAIGEQVENVANDHESGTVVAVFPTVDGSFRYAVDTEGYGTLQFFAEEKLAFAVRGEVPHDKPCNHASDLRERTDGGRQRCRAHQASA